MTTTHALTKVLPPLGSLAAVVVLVGCASIREPVDFACSSLGCATGIASAQPTNPIDAAYRRKLIERLRLAARQPVSTTAAPSPNRPLYPEEVDHFFVASAAAATATPDAAALGLPRNRFVGAVAVRHFVDRWRTARQRLYLNAAGARDQDGKGSSAPFVIDAGEAISHDIALAHPPGASALSSFKDDRRPLAVAARCDGPFEVHGAGGMRSSSGAETSFALPYSARLAGAVRLSFAGSTSHCTLTYGYADDKARRRIELKRKSQSDVLASVDSRYDVCVLPNPRGLEPIEKLFFTDVSLATGCVEGVGSIKTLPDAERAFQAKVTALLGKPLPRAMIAAENPFMPIDFSAAPKLEAILISSLVIKNDFSGQVFARLLEHHARQGTPVRILVARASLLRKDRKLVEGLAAANPNIELAEWRWKAPPGSSFKDLLSQLHKVHHIKMLVTLGKHPGDNVSIIGGRNIHDGFLFKDPPDLSRWPNLNQYTKGYGGMNPFIFFNDFDVEVRGRAFAETMAVQFSTLFLRDEETFASRPPALLVQSDKRIGRRALAGRTLVRHFTSVPYADGRSLEAFYVEVFDSARKTIDISSPYLNLTPAIEAAFARAVERGVKIRIVTRIDLRGDIAGAILSQVNKDFINAYYDRAAIYESTTEEKILHSKIVRVDDDFTLVGGVNLNKRSFIHDTENGFAVLGSDFARRIDRLLASYRKDAVRVTAPREIPKMLHMLISIPLVDELF